MKKILKKGHHGVIAQLFSLDVQTFIAPAPSYLRIIINNHSKVFCGMPKGFPPARDHDHAIHLQPGSVPPNIMPYRYPYAYKSEFEHMIQEMLEVDIIQPRQSDFSPLVVMVFKKDSSWHMCRYYRELNKITIKDKFPIPIIDELLDEQHGPIYFTKLDLCSGYHQKLIFNSDLVELSIIWTHTP